MFSSDALICWLYQFLYVQVCPTLSLGSFPLFQQFKHHVNKKGLTLAKCSAWEIDPKGGWLQFPATLAT